MLTKRRKIPLGISLFNCLKIFIFEPHIKVCMYLLTTYVVFWKYLLLDDLGHFDLQVTEKHQIGLTSEDDRITEVISSEACLSGSNTVIQTCFLSVSLWFFGFGSVGYWALWRLFLNVPKLPSHLNTTGKKVFSPPPAGPESAPRCLLLNTKWRKAT